MTECTHDDIQRQGAAMKRRGLVAEQVALVAGRIRPPSARPVTSSRRALLKGAGAALFTTALLATGEVVPVSPFAVAAADPAARPSGPGTALATAEDTLYQTYVGTDFQPNSSSKGKFDPSEAGIPSGGPVQFVMGSSATFSAHLDLPQEATIVEVIFQVFHNDANPMYVQIARIPSDGSGGAIIASTSVFITMSSIQMITLSPASTTVVNNAQNSYVLEWTGGTPSSAHRLYGARIGYTLPGSAAVYGNAQAGVGAYGLSASGVGVLGQGDAAGGVGVKGASVSGTGVAGQATDAANAHARVLGLGTKGPGVQGQSDGYYGLVGFTNATDGHSALIGYANAAGGIGLIGNAPGGAFGGGLAGVFNGDVTINGALRVYGSPKNAAVKHPADGSYRLLYCEESPESWFADYGRGTLAGGKAEIKLDPDFAKLIHTDDYHVFVTAEGPQQLYVSQRTAAGFTVTALPGGTTGGGWRGRRWRRGPSRTG